MSNRRNRKPGRGKRNRILQAALVFFSIAFLIPLCVFVMNIVRPDESIVEISEEAPEMEKAGEPVRETRLLPTEEPSAEPAPEEEPSAEPVPEEEPLAEDTAVNEETAPAENAAPSGAEEILAGMSLEEKVYQLFIVTPEALTGMGTVTAAGKTTEKTLEQYPVGGLIYFAQNLVDPEQTRDMLKNTREYSLRIEGMPLFLCIDEEGGRVARVGKNPAFQVEKIPCMRDIQNAEEARKAGETIGAYLSDLGFNFDFAPDADVLTNSGNQVIGDRSFGSDPARVTELALAVSDGLHSQKMLTAFKHFPGHGATLEDTHKGFAYTDKSYEELLESELKPFAAAGANGVDAVMAAHISVPGVTGDNTPSSLSEKMLTEVLRKDLGYQGLIVTDALNMGAITQQYGSGQAAVMALQAGADLLLMPADLNQAVQAILKAVSEGKISEERINESVRRIINVKICI